MDIIKHNREKLKVLKVQDKEDDKYKTILSQASNLASNLIQKQNEVLPSFKNEISGLEESIKKLEKKAALNIPIPKEWKDVNSVYQFEIEEQIGEGGFAVVKRAKIFNQTVALKCTNRISIIDS